MTYDNESVYKNATIHTFVLNKKMHSISYHFYHEVIACGLYYISKEDSTINFNELFTKMLATWRREYLLDKFMYWLKIYVSE